jgi:hypothetical protein
MIKTDKKKILLPTLRSLQILNSSTYNYTTAMDISSLLVIIKTSGNFIPTIPSDPEHPSSQFCRRQF